MEPVCFLNWPRAIYAFTPSTQGRYAQWTRYMSQVATDHSYERFSTTISKHVFVHICANQNTVDSIKSHLYYTEPGSGIATSLSHGSTERRSTEACWVPS
jgi:hypothetical protein